MRSWLALAAGWTLAAVAVALSTKLSLATRLVFHFHPIAIVVGSAWAYRRLNGERPCPAYAVAFLVGLTTLLSGAAADTAAAGLVDPPWLAIPIAIIALVCGWWILVRRDATVTVSSEPRP
jgi:hypothetical protein